MDSELDKSPGLAFSQAAPEQVPVPISDYPVQPQKADFALSQQPVGAPPQQSVMSSQTAQQSAVLSGSQQAAASISATADDVDALDEEWINKAKAIVERTRNDPYAESQELSKAKADYLRIRYNKQVKVAEDR